MSTNYLSYIWIHRRPLNYNIWTTSIDCWQKEKTSRFERQHTIPKRVRGTDTSNTFIRSSSPYPNSPQTKKLTHIKVKTSKSKLPRVGSNHQPLDTRINPLTVERASQLRHEGFLLVYVELRKSRLYTVAIVSEVHTPKMVVKWLAARVY